MPTPKADFTLDLLGLVIGAERELRDAKATILDNLLASARSLMDDLRAGEGQSEPKLDRAPVAEPEPVEAPAPTQEPDDLLASAPRGRGRPRKVRPTDAPQAEPAPAVAAQPQEQPEGDDLLAEPTPETAPVAPEDQGEDFFGGLQ